MRIGIEMTTEEHRFSVGSWWATSPDFVLDTLHRQLEAAKILWPEIKGYAIRKSAALPPDPGHQDKGR